MYKGSLILLLSLGLIACNKLNQTPTSGSEETAISSVETQQKPLKINSNKRYIKHRVVNRRLVQRAHRLHRS